MGPSGGATFKFRIQDLFLAIAFGALIWLAHDAWERAFMAGLAVLQLVEGRIPLLDTTWGRATSVVLQLTLGYLLVGLTGAIASPYYLVLLLPIVSTASYLGFTGTLISTLVAIGAYLSFLSSFYVNWSEVEIDPEAVHVLAIRCLLPAVAALLVNSLGEAIRTQSARYKAAAEQLAKANQDLIAAEAAMRRADRLAALGQLSAGLAHELRNPLGSIKGSADLLARSASADPMTKELAGIISSEVDRTNSLVTRFLDFARPLEPRRETVDVTAVIDRAADRAKVQPVREYDPSLPPMSIDPTLMEQVFLNLLSNAAQASQPGAPITVRTRKLDGQAEIAVIDRGCGIPADKIDTIFNPFVTTRRDGVGLGLAIVARIVDGHGGKMTVESEPGKGSTFRVVLPLEPSPKP
ncbi:MAG TPA: ATP-binding protein [Bryobacteraceae bacterium]|nr:ATP-binding protein [Bryobacteraceae bacterium]